MQKRNQKTFRINIMLKHMVPVATTHDNQMLVRNTLYDEDLVVPMSVRNVAKLSETSYLMDAAYEPKLVAELGKNLVHEWIGREWLGASERSVYMDAMGNFYAASV
jgi:hypothetical protein